MQHSIEKKAYRSFFGPSLPPPPLPSLVVGHKTVTHTFTPLDS